MSDPTALATPEGHQTYERHANESQGLLKAPYQDQKGKADGNTHGGLRCGLPSGAKVTTVLQKCSFVLVVNHSQQLRTCKGVPVKNTKPYRMSLRNVKGQILINDIPIIQLPSEVSLQ